MLKTIRQTKKRKLPFEFFTVSTKLAEMAVLASKDLTKGKK